jgi:hypothetical protein
MKMWIFSKMWVPKIGDRRGFADYESRNFSTQGLEKLQSF